MNVQILLFHWDTALRRNVYFKTSALPINDRRVYAYLVTGIRSALDVRSLKVLLSPFKKASVSRLTGYSKKFILGDSTVRDLGLDSCTEYWYVNRTSCSIEFRYAVPRLGISKLDLDSGGIVVFNSKFEVEKFY